MKHTTKKLLALFLVLAMAIGMVPLSVLSVGAERTLANEIEIGEDGAVGNVRWNSGYMLSTAAPEGFSPWEIVNRSNFPMGPYFYTDILIVPEPGTTLIWSEAVSVDGEGSPMLMEDQYSFLTSWKEISENNWELDHTGVNLNSGHTKNSADYPAANYIYDADAGRVTYTYTTTKQNEALRFGCYGGDLSQGLPQIYAFTPAFRAGNTDGFGTVDNVAWLDGYVGSYANEQGSANKIFNGGELYSYSAPIIVPKANTTISFTGASSSSAEYVFSAWRVGNDGGLELIYGCQGGDENSAWLTVNEDEGSVSQTYFYTTSYDNEIVRLTCKKGETAPIINYIEDNGSVLTPVLKAAGYDPEINGVPHMLNWSVGAIKADTGSIDTSSDAYRYSDALAVFGSGTKVTFVDVMGDAQAGVNNFANSSYLVFAKATEEPDLYEGSCGADDDDRAAAVNKGKLVYTYETEAEAEQLRLTVACTGNMVNRYFVAPIVYVGETDTAGSYSALQGKTVVALGDFYLNGGSIGAENTWLSMLANRYDMKYYNYSVSDSTVATQTGVASMVDICDDMADVDADIVVFEGGKNDFLKNVVLGEQSSNDPATFHGAVKQILNGLMEKYPNALIVCVTAWEEDAYTNAFADYAESLNDDRVCVVPTFDATPVFMADPDFKALYSYELGSCNLLNPAGHRFVLPWLEALIGNAYENYLSISVEGKGVKFVADGHLVDAHGTLLEQGCTIIAPAATDAVCAENMFGWYGVLTNGNTTKAMLIKVGEEVTFEQGDIGVFEPLTLNIVQVSEPTLRLKKEANSGDYNGGLRFLSGVSKVEYQNLLDMIASGALGDAQEISVSFGTLIASQNDVINNMNGQLTHDPDNANDIIDVGFHMVFNGAGDPVWYEETEDFGYISGSAFIDENDHVTDFIAAGYAKLTIGEKDYYAYGRNADKKGTSLYEMAIQALNDVSTERDSDHKLQIHNGLYAANTVSERNALRGFVENVVELKTLADGTAIEFVEYDYYDSSAQWSITEYTQYDTAWSTLVEKIGNTNLTKIYMITAADGSALTDVDLVLDGVKMESDPIEALGVSCYLLGISEYGSDC